MQEQHKGDTLYPLAEHLLGILDAPEPIRKLKEEAKRYTKWLEEETSGVYGTNDRTPDKRPAFDWNEYDLKFMRLEWRRSSMSILVQAIEEEERLLRDYAKESRVRRLLRLLRTTLEQTEEINIPAVSPRSGGISIIRLTPPLQRLFVEIKLIEKQIGESTDGYEADIFLIQAVTLRCVFARWIMELLPVDKLVLLAGVNPGLGSWDIDHDWMMMLHPKKW